MKVHYDELGNITGYSNDAGDWITKEQYEAADSSEPETEEEEESEDIPE